MAEVSTNDLMNYIGKLHSEHDVYIKKLVQNYQETDMMMEELRRRFDQVEAEKQQTTLDLEREIAYNREGQRQTQRLTTELRDAKLEKELDPFILVLIDGDGMIFADSLIQRGEIGGKEAAGKLWSAIRHYVNENVSAVHTEYKIIARVYANQKGLGDVCHRAGIMETPLLIEDFARGFTGSKQLFDFVDVGSGKDRADEKISEMFRINLNNVHCRSILLGCSHDNGYARLLEEVAEHPRKDKITLLEGIPFERELSLFKSTFANIKFEDLFRNTKINLYPQYQHPSLSKGANTMSSSQQVFSSHMAPPGIPFDSTFPPDGTARNGTSQNGLQHNLNQSGYQSPYQPTVSRAASTSTTNSTPVASWASKVVSTSPAQLASPPPTPKPAQAAISRNKYGQRVDNLIKFDISDLKRVQRLKMCNVYWLRGDCQYGDECTHLHDCKDDVNLKDNIEILRQITRGTPCKNGTECPDVKCIYGHRCPHSVENSKICKFGDSCRFETGMHGVDLKVVRTTKIS